MSSVSRLLAGLLVAGILFDGSAEAAPSLLMPHRAVYDLRLADPGENGAGDMAAVSGRMVYEFTGAPCEGWTVNFRFVVEMVDSEGQSSVTDLRASTFESGGGDSFDFLSQTYTNQVLTDEVKGKATSGTDGLGIELVSPAEMSAQRPGPVRFPTDHMLSLIDAAKAGRQVVTAAVFDGSETGDKVYRTTSFIGPEITAPPEGEEIAVGVTRHWPVTVSYFDSAGSGDQTPDYTIAFNLWENGVSTQLHMDYGDFALDGRLSSFERLAAVECR